MEATYFAALPNPGVWSVRTRSLSIRLRNSDEFHVTADLLRVAGELVDGIHGVVSADIEEVTDVHLTEIVKDRRIDFTLEVCRKLIAAGAEVCGRSQL